MTPLTSSTTRENAVVVTKIQIWGFRCERCSHEWVPRDRTKTPTVCPKCKSAYWNTPRRSKR